jgi:hypothetical protein
MSRCWHISIIAAGVDVAAAAEVAPVASSYYLQCDISAQGETSNLIISFSVRCLVLLWQRSQQTEQKALL